MTEQCVWHELGCVSPLPGKQNATGRKFQYETSSPNFRSAEVGDQP
jgi:hypothetical protein